MTATTGDPISAKLAVEKILAHRIEQDPGFAGQLALDPEGSVKPIIREVLADDGELDMSDVAISVHLETDDRIHLVVPVSTDEVVGFSSRGFGSSFRTTSVSFGGMRPPMKSGLESHSGVCICPSEDCETQVACDLTNTCK